MSFEDSGINVCMPTFGLSNKIKLKIVSRKFDKKESEFCNGCISPE